MDISWKSLTVLRKEAVYLLKALVLVVLADLLISALSPFFLSDEFYFERLGDDGVGDGHYDKVTSSFYNGGLRIQPSTNGWVNTPDFKVPYEHWEWHVGPNGAHQSPSKDLNLEAHDGSKVFLVGSSAMLGFELKYQNRLVGQLEEKHYDAYDFSSVMYSVDQSYSLYHDTLVQYDPNVLIIGIHSEAEAVTSMYTPFRPKGHNWDPWVKPAYSLTPDRKLIRKNPPQADQRSRNVSSFLKALKQNDPNYFVFEYYKHMSLLPISDFIRWLWVNGSEEVLFDVDRYKKDFEVQAYFMEQLVKEAKKNNTEVLFIKFEAQDELKNPLHVFYKDKNSIHNEMLKEMPMNVLFLSDVLLKTGEPIDHFFFPTGEAHLNERGTKLLAEQVTKELVKLNVN